MNDRKKEYELLKGYPGRINYELSDDSAEEPDEWDLEMIEEARRENDGNRVSIEDLVEEFGAAV